MSAHADRDLLSRVADELTQAYPDLSAARALATAVQCVADLELTASSGGRLEEPTVDALVAMARRRLGP